MFRTAAWAAFLLLVPLAVCGPALSQSTAKEGRSHGVFVDSEGASHEWSISDAHALIWDSKPYIPVGGMFCSKYLTNGQTDENWKADTEALQTVKSHGISDLYVNPVHGATGIPPEAWQRFADYLDSQGFRYGIELADGPDMPLTGWVIRPSLYRLPDIAAARTVTFDLPAAVGGIWALADAKSGDIVKTGRLAPSGGKVSIEVDGKPDARRVLLVYPIKTVDSYADGLQNFWEGFGGYRDRLVSVMGKVRFGKGLRFWVDPFINEMGMRGETQYLIPDSRMFQIEFESWLQKRYRDAGELARAWGLTGEIKTYEQASRMIPLWHDVKGLTYAYNTSDGHLSKLGSTDSQMWSDIQRFRDDSIRKYLNSAAMVLERHVANVPVVVKWTASSDFFINDDSEGYDGIGVEAYGTPAVIGPLAGAQCLALVRQWSRPAWLLTTETQTTGAVSKETPCYASKTEMMASLGALQDAGSKGFFVFGLQLLPEPTWKNFELVRTPEQLGWLREFQQGLEAQPLFADWTPRAVWFSSANPLGADIRRLEQDLWWLPRRTSAARVDVEDGVQAYALQGAVGSTVYIWTSGTPRSIELPVSPGVKPSVHFTGPDERQMKSGSKALTLPLTRDPAIVTGLPPTAFVTVDGLQRQISHLSALISRAEGMQILSGEQKMALDNAKAMIHADRLSMASMTLSRAIAELEPLVAPYFWAEGENASETNFDGFGYDTGASGSRYLKLSTAQEPPLAPYTASFPVVASMESDYEVWMAGTPPGQQWSSAASWSVDGSSWTPIRGAAPQGEAYATDLFWSRIATMHLSPGRHVFRIRADARRQLPDKNYVMYIDALVLSREPFTPNGARRPEIK